MKIPAVIPLRIYVDDNGVKTYDPEYQPTRWECDWCGREVVRSDYLTDMGFYHSVAAEVVYPAGWVVVHEFGPSEGHRHEELAHYCCRACWEDSQL